MNLDHDTNQNSLACSALRNDLWSSLAVSSMSISRVVLIYFTGHIKRMFYDVGRVWFMFLQHMVQA